MLDDPILWIILVNDVIILIIYTPNDMLSNITDTLHFQRRKRIPLIYIPFLFSAILWSYVSMKLNMFDTLEKYMLFANIWIPLTIISKKRFRRILVVASVLIVVWFEIYKSHKNQHELRVKTSFYLLCCAVCVLFPC